MGPLKIISDGSLNTRTAWCCEPYGDAHRLEYPAGQPNLSGAELRDAARPRARRRPRDRDPRDRRRGGARRRWTRTPTPAPAARSSTPSWSAARTCAGWPSSASAPASSPPTCSTTATSPSRSGASGPSAASRSAGCSTTASSSSSAPTRRSRRSTRGWRWRRPCTAAPTTATRGTASRRSPCARRSPPRSTGSRRSGPARRGDLVLLDRDPLLRDLDHADTAALGAALRAHVVGVHDGRRPTGPRRPLTPARRLVGRKGSHGDRARPPADRERVAADRRRRAGRQRAARDRQVGRRRPHRIRGDGRGGGALLGGHRQRGVPADRRAQGQPAARRGAPARLRARDVHLVDRRRVRPLHRRRGGLDLARHLAS